MIVNITSKFPLGTLVMTRGVNDQVADNEVFAKFVLDSIRRHATRDWGDICPEDKTENELALKSDLRLFSSYALPEKIASDQQVPKIWIITEADRSATTVLFPDEY